jgi:hypothetical protein
VFHCGEQGIFMLSYVSICVCACYAMLLYIRPDTLTLQRAGHIHALVCEYLGVRMLLYMRPDALSLPPTSILLLSLLLYVCPRTTCVSSYYYMCPHTTIYVFSCSPPRRVRPLLYYYYRYYCMCVLVLLYMRTHTTICVLMLSC